MHLISCEKELKKITGAKSKDKDKDKKTDTTYRVPDAIKDSEVKIHAINENGANVSWLMSVNDNVSIGPNVVVSYDRNNGAQIERVGIGFSATWR